MRKSLRVGEGYHGGCSKEFSGHETEETGKRLKISSGACRHCSARPQPLIGTFLPLPLLALVQIGPLVTAVIAGGILLVKSTTLAASLIMVWFLVIITSVYNVIRPYFASRAIDTPAFLTFLGVISGLLAFGLIGVFIGPVLIALLQWLLMIWLERETLKVPLGREGEGGEGAGKVASEG